MNACTPQWPEAMEEWSKIPPQQCDRLIVSQRKQQSQFFWRGLNNMLLSFSSYIYLILRSGRDKFFLFVCLFYAINKPLWNSFGCRPKPPPLKGLSPVVSVHTRLQLLCSHLHKETAPRAKTAQAWKHSFSNLMFLLLSAKNGFKMVQKGRIRESNS